MDWLAIFTFVLALATVGLAVATFFLVKETQKVREEQTRQHDEDHRRQKEVVFRAAIAELAGCIVDLERWELAFRSQGMLKWNYPLRFPKLSELMDKVWVHPKLWIRIIGGSLIEIGRFEAELYGLVSNQDEDPNRANRLAEVYYVLDIYLKQLARYVYCEMQRQGLTPPEEIWNTRVFQPIARNYGRADLYELQGGLPREPDDPAFRECRFEVLFAQALAAGEALNREVRGQFSG